MDNRPIGIFDSGLGGLTAVRRLQARLPAEELLFLGDTGRVPYGGRDRATLRRFAREDLDFLLHRQVKAVIAACGTISSVAMDVLAASGIPVFGVVEPAAARAAAITVSGRVGIIGTEAAIASGAYGAALGRIAPHCQLRSSPCPRFVPMIEQGLSCEDPALLSAAEAYIAPLREFGMDTLIWGCTHYPLIEAAIRQVAGEGVQLVDVAAQAVDALAEALEGSDALHSPGAGSLRCYVTGSPGRFAAAAGRFLQGNRHLQVSPAVLDTQE